MDPPRFRPSADLPLVKSTKRTNSGRVKDGGERPSSAASRLSHDSKLQQPAQLPVQIPVQTPIPPEAKGHIEALLHYDIREVHRWIQLAYQERTGHPPISPEHGANRVSFPQLNPHASFQSTDTITQRRISTVSSAPSSLHPGSTGLQSRRVSNGSVFSVAPSTNSIASDLTAYTDASSGPQVVQYVNFAQPQTYSHHGHMNSMHAPTFQSFEWPQPSGPQVPSVYPSSQPPNMRHHATSKKNSMSIKVETSETASPKISKAEDQPKTQKYVCTSCETKFIRKSDWKQHEERLHERRNQWRCPDCNLDQLWSRNQFKQHHKQAHGCENCPHADAAVIPLKQRTAWGCGFCAQLHHDWEERCQHVAQHYDKGKTKKDWKHSNVIWGLLHQADIHEAWRNFLREKHGSRPNPRPSYAWDKKVSGRSHEVDQQGQPTRLQDMLEYGGEPRDVSAIVHKAYELGIVDAPDSAGGARPDSEVYYAKFEADGRVLASPSPTGTGSRSSQLTMSSTNSGSDRRPSTTMSSPVVNNSPVSNPPVEASPMSIVSPLQQLAGQLSVTDVSNPTQVARIQPPMHPSIFSGNAMQPTPSWTPQEASNYHQMQYPIVGMNQSTTPTADKALPPLPPGHFEVPFMPQNQRFSDDSCFTGILFSQVDEECSTFADTIPDNLSFNFQTTDDQMPDHLS